MSLCEQLACPLEGGRSPVRKNPGPMLWDLPPRSAVLHTARYLAATVPKCVCIGEALQGEREDRTSSEPADLHFTVNNRRKGREEEEGCVKKSLTEARNRALQTNVDSSKYYKCLNHSKSKNVTDTWVILKPSLCVSAPMTRNCCLEGRAVGALVKQ